MFPPGTPACGQLAQKLRALAGAVLGDQQNGAAPLTADGEALDEAQRHQQSGGPVPDLSERGQAAHQEGGGAHQQQAELQQLLASVAIPELAEDDAAKRAGGEADGVGHEGGEDGVEVVAALGEEHLAEHQRGRGAVEEEFVPFDDGAGHGCGDHSPKVGVALLKSTGLQRITQTHGLHLLIELSPRALVCRRWQRTWPGGLAQGMDVRPLQSVTGFPEVT